MLASAPPAVCKDGDACGMKVHAVKQKRIAAEDVLLPSVPPDVGMCVCVCVCVLFFSLMCVTLPMGLTTFLSHLQRALFSRRLRYGTPKKRILTNFGRPFMWEARYGQSLWDSKNKNEQMSVVHFWGKHAMMGAKKTEMFLFFFFGMCLFSGQLQKLYRNESFL